MSALGVVEAVGEGLGLIGTLADLGKQLAGGAISLGQYRDGVAAAYTAFDAAVVGIDARFAAVVAEGEALADGLPERQPVTAAIVAAPINVAAGGTAPPAQPAPGGTTAP